MLKASSSATPYLPIPFLSLFQVLMENMYNWLSQDFNAYLIHDFAIRRFCPARNDREQGVDWEEVAVDVNEVCSPSEVTVCTPCLSSSEVDEFVDSLINMDYYDINEVKESQEKQQIIEHFQDGIEAHSLMDAFEDVPMMIEEDEYGGNECFRSAPATIVNRNGQGMNQGLHLVHMLLACAEAVGCRDIHLAESILSKIWVLSSPWGDSLQRVSYCFARGLSCRLSKLHHVANVAPINDIDASVFTKEENLEAFRLLYQTTPYVSFGFMAANEVICQAAQGKGSLHIIDLGMEHALQWPSLIRSLASRPEGPPMLRITGLTTGDDVLELEASMKALVEEARSLGIMIEFNIVSEEVSPYLLTKERLNIREGETLFVNSIMQLHKYVKESRGSLKAILQAFKKLGPTAFTVVEQDANHNGPFFLGRFLESLHYYSALFDSLEASLPRNSPPRMKIERLRFAGEICNIVANEGPERIERHERVDQWRRQLGRAGFQVIALKCMSQARMMLSVYGCDGYTLANEKGCLLLGWKGRTIMMASAWKCTV